ncbi:MAG: CBASS cGAMP-activated phospholipase [Balneolaceae bacterium]
MAVITNNQKSVTVKVFEENQIVQILSLDGGGLRGLFSTAVIESLENQLGNSITKHFDIITGTSTGGLIALGLGLGKKGEAISQFYQKDGPRIFPNSGYQKVYRFLKGWLFNKYSNHQLESTLKKLLRFDNESDNVPLLGDSSKRLIIPTFYAANSRPRLFKTPHDKRYRSDWKIPMWAVAMATSAAPTYFPSFKYKGNTYLDGGIWANNPSLIGVIEALEMGAKIENIRVLNITTTSSNTDCLVFKIPFLPLKAPYGRLGKIPWATRILEVIMQANSFSTTHMYLRQMLAEGNLAVIDDLLNYGHAGLDDINYDEFYTRGISAAEQAKNSLNLFFEHLAPEYKPNEEAIKNGN